MREALYPETAGERDSWILSTRSERNPVDVSRPYAFAIEEEPSESGEVEGIATIFLTNRECPWQCLMCDLWKNTTAEKVPVGAIPRQIDHALGSMAKSRCQKIARPLQGIKLYNSGSFFDPNAIPPEDYDAIAQRVRDFDRVIVECHPALVRDPVVRFQDFLQKRPSPANARLEVAMGLETVHPEVLAKLNKRMTLDQFARAADFLGQNGIALRVFILVQPPFMDEEEGVAWAQRSLDFAFQCGAGAASLIPTRGGNGAMEALQRTGHFAPPKISALEAALDYGLGLGRGRVFADLWDLDGFANCRVCFSRRRERLQHMNLRQQIAPAIKCEACCGNS